jgi:Mn2+/Fe2+ NRAMP family transporter
MSEQPPSVPPGDSQTYTSDSSAETPASEIQSPPNTLGGILRRLGPGLIIAASIVGSGELIATTKTGAEAGFALLWLIIIGCVIKVFVQVEFGRYAICTGQTSMDGMNELPGPRLRVGWLVWYWLIMTSFSIAQLGGIVGAVGEAMAIAVPFTQDYTKLIEAQQDWDDRAKPIRAALVEQHREALSSRDWRVRDAAHSKIKAELKAQLRIIRPSRDNTATRDDVYWATIIAIATAVMLVLGRYGFIQNVSTFLVAGFTLITLGNLIALQWYPHWAISWENLKSGLRFSLPTARLGSLDTPLATALAAFGIIGVGASEIVAYPYWCLAKGYARFTGPREASSAWAARANGWLRVLRWDAWCSMVIYTFATVAFFLLGAAVLNREGINPSDDQLVPELTRMYVHVFGEYAEMLFLLGAFAVLYSTFFVATAGHARVCADGVKVFKLRPDTEPSRRWWTVLFSGLFPFVSLLIFIFYRKPGVLVLASGICQAIMLPMLAAAALFFRYRRSDPRTMPGPIWDIFLWVSAGGLLVAGGWAALVKLIPQMKLLG